MIFGGVPFFYPGKDKMKHFRVRAVFHGKRAMAL